jgi:pimeloyl-ACP methyl ester carboxylesterase
MEIALVLLPGLDGTGTMFAPLQETLGPGITPRVVSYGNASQNYAQHITLARAALPPKGPYLILGESFSGPVAVALAGKAPPGLLGIVLCASFIRCPRPTLARLRPLLPLVSRVGSKPRLVSFLLMGRYATPELRSLEASALAQVSQATLEGRLRAVSKVDVTAAARTVRVPCLYLRATEDRVVPAAASEAVAGAIPQCTVRDVEGPHLLLQTRPAECANAIRAFAGTVLAAR